MRLENQYERKKRDVQGSTSVAGGRMPEATKEARAELNSYKIPLKSIEIGKQGLADRLSHRLDPVRIVLVVNTNTQRGPLP